MTNAPRRLLFTAAGGHGHLQPLLPIAEQAAEDGHEVLVSGAASLAGHVADWGLQYVPTGPDLQPIQAPLVVHDVDQERAAVGAYFVSRLGRGRAAALVELFRSWGPDVVIRDEVDFGSVVAACCGERDRRRTVHLAGRREARVPQLVGT